MFRDHCTYFLSHLGCPVSQRVNYATSLAQLMSTSDKTLPTLRHLFTNSIQPLYTTIHTFLTRVRRGSRCLNPEPCAANRGCSILSGATIAVIIVPRYRRSPIAIKINIFGSASALFLFLTHRVHRTQRSGAFIWISLANPYLPILYVYP